MGYCTSILWDTFVGFILIDGCFIACPSRWIVGDPWVIRGLFVALAIAVERGTFSTKRYWLANWGVISDHCLWVSCGIVFQATH